VQVDSIKPRVESAYAFSFLSYNMMDRRLSNFAFNVNLRRYSSERPQYLARLVPVERTCPATVPHIVEAVKSLLTQHFPIPRPAPHGGPTTFAVHYEHHGETDLPRQELIRAVGALLPEPDYKVDLHEEDETIVIHVYHSVALVSVLPGFHATRQYNVHELLEVGPARCGSPCNPAQFETSEPGQHRNLGPGRCCSPRHRMPFKSINEG